MKHILWMVLGCTLPLLLLFFAPALGLNTSISIFIFMLAMFACHLLMPMHHEEPRHGEQNKTSTTPKNKQHEH